MKMNHEYTHDNLGREAWDKIMTKLGLEDIEISDNRY